MRQVSVGYPLDFALASVTKVVFICIQKLKVIKSFSVPGV